MRFLTILLAGSLGMQSTSSGFGEERSLLTRPRTARSKQSVWLDANRIKLCLTNRGGLDFRAGDGIGGGVWPDTTDMYKNAILFDFGPWVIGKMAETPKMGFTQWGSSYSPGPAIGMEPALIARPEDSLRYRLYKINRGDNPLANADYRDWPTDLGAPVDEDGNPRLFADQTVWGVFNNLDSTAISDWWRKRMPTPGLPIVVQQAVYAHRVSGLGITDLLGNVAFVEWTIINCAESPIESSYVGLWADIDFNNTPDNVPAVDTLDQLGYCWQSRDDSYFFPPRAVGFVWLYGPSVPSPGSHALFRGRQRQNFKNLRLSSFWGIRDEGYPDSSFFGPINSIDQAWNVARGFDKAAHPILDSVTHQITKFPYSGNPATGSGWVGAYGGAGAGCYMFSGPFTLAPHDTQWVMAALVPASNVDRLECVRILRQYAAALRTMEYPSLVTTGLQEGGQLEDLVAMNIQQNYPNPFNLETVIKYHVALAKDVNIAVYDLLGREVAVLVHERKAPGNYEVRFDGTGLASGAYFYRMTAGNFIQSRKFCIVK
jgi:hypothetical protein